MVDIDIITTEGKYIRCKTDDAIWLIATILGGPLKFRRVDARAREVAIYRRDAKAINQVATNKCTGAIVGHCVILSIDAFDQLGFDKRYIE